MNSRRPLMLIFSIFIPALGLCQTFQTAGNWDTGSNWSGGTEPTGATTDVTVNANPTISTANTIGAITDSNSITYSINSGGSLTVGASGTTKNMTFGNSGTINISSGGSLEIWGDLIVSNNLTLSVTGTLIVHGNIQMNNGSSITVSGSGVATVGGNLTGGQNTSITVTLGGSLAVTGALTLTGSGTSINKVLGTITAGSCTCGSCGALTNCSSVTLPVTLLSFSASERKGKIDLIWATATEINFDYFILEKSADGIQFFDQAHIAGSGTSFSRRDYAYEDEHPFTGLFYYRLTSIDFDGYTETFNNNVVSVHVNAEREFRLFPNPVTEGKVKAKMNFESSANAELLIFNPMGVLLCKFQMMSPETIISLPSLSDGVYVAKFNSDQFSQAIRFVVSTN